MLKYINTGKFVQHTFLNSFRLLSILVLLINLISCASVSPVSSAREQPAAFMSVEDVEPVWQFFAEGIGYFYGKASRPKIEFWALQIDLFAPNIGFVVRGGAMTEDGSTLSTRVSSFVRDNDLIAGINAAPFNFVSAKEGVPLLNMGIVVSDGKLIAPPNPHYDALVFYNTDNEHDSRAAIVNQSAIDSIDNIENAIGGFQQILKDGEPVQRILNLQPRHPRSAAGISPNGRYLYLVVIDGRRPGSIGTTEKETALLLRSLGSWDAINFDGGGSSALVLRYPDGRIRAVNTPIHSGIPGRERAVAGCLGMKVRVLDNFSY